MNGKWAVAVLFLAAAIFVWAILQLFEVRFSRGDVYPPYSSLRTDPLGAKAFYESLDGLEGVTVTRNETALEQFVAPPGSTLLCVGTTGLNASETEIIRLEHFVRRGGRLVIAFYPQSRETNLVEKPPPKNVKSTPSPSPSPSPDDEEPAAKFLTTRDVEKRWELKFQAAGDLVKNSAKAVNPTTIDPEISWHSALHFKDSGENWRNIYVSGELPVVIERSMGSGTIVLASDSYFVSNEALRRERHPAFLAWLVGANQNVIFDETHLGISQTPGISTLMRRYHLGGLLAGLAVLAALAVWKNSARLVPVTEAKANGDEIVLGKESFGGFVNLLRRNIAPAEVLPLAIEQWSKRMTPSATESVTAAGQKSPERSRSQIERAKQIIEQYPRDVVGAYQQIARAIHETKWNPHKTN